MARVSLERGTRGAQTWWERVNPGDDVLRGRAYERAKRAFDITVVVIMAPITLPLMLACVLAITLTSPGAPAVFHQKRTGMGGRSFDMLKLRTMVPEAEALKAQLQHLNELHWPDFKITHDPRITVVGRILRSTSLDELPQLLNVLRGDMSLVGPRPTSFGHETYALWQTARLDVRPGVTGLWQVVGRGSMEFNDRVRLDMAYVQRRCLTLDALILIHTLLAVARRRGAH